MEVTTGRFAAVATPTAATAAAATAAAAKNKDMKVLKKGVTYPSVDIREKVNKLKKFD